jgi:hypothetical protein
MQDKRLLGVILGLIAVSSIWYHWTEEKQPEFFDELTILLSAPGLLYLLSTAINPLIPSICFAVAALGFLSNLQELCWKTHFLRVHIPALVGFSVLTV